MSRVINVERVKDSKAEDTIRRAAIALEDNNYEREVEIDGLVCIPIGDLGASGAAILRGVLEKVVHDSEHTELNVLADIGKNVICFDKVGLESFSDRLRYGFYEIEEYMLAENKPFRKTVKRFKIDW